MTVWALLGGLQGALASPPTYVPAERTPIALEGGPTSLASHGSSVAMVFADRASVAQDGGLTTIPLQGGTVALTPTALWTCSPDGVERVPLAAPGERQRFSEQACTRIAVAGDRVAVLQDDFATFDSFGKREVISRTSGFQDLVAFPGGVAALSTDLIVRQGTTTSLVTAPAHAVSVVRDGDGWAFGVGGESPGLILADGTHIALPAAPSLVAVEGGFAGFVGPLFLSRTGAGTVEQADLGLALTGLVVADLDDDGCDDLLGLHAEGGSRFLGRCAPVEAPVAVAAPVEAPPRAPLPTSLELGEEWPMLDLLVGDSAVVQLVAPESAPGGFSTRGGPSTLLVSEHGVLRYLAKSTDIGIWRTSVQSGGSKGPWSGVVVRVGDPRPTEVIDGVESLEERSAPPKSPFAFRECYVTGGVEFGLSKNNRSDWSSVGLPDVVPAVSPAVALTCGGGGEGRLGWYLGADSAPAYYYLAPGGRMAHVLAVTAGFEARGKVFRAGPFITAGLLRLGAGVRVMAVPFETKKGKRHGIDLRLTGFPVFYAGAISLGYTIGFGEF